jgi:hypothetical protein
VSCRRPPCRAPTSVDLWVSVPYTSMHLPLCMRVAPALIPARIAKPALGHEMPCATSPPVLLCAICLQPLSCAAVESHGSTAARARCIRERRERSAAAGGLAAAAAAQCVCPRTWLSNPAATCARVPPCLFCCRPTSLLPLIPRPTATRQRPLVSPPPHLPSG